MKPQKKYSYDDWWEGKVFLKEYCPIAYKQGDKYKGVNWEDIYEKDIPKIKERQEKLFYEKCAILLNEKRSEFIGNYGRSLHKNLLLDKELNQCEDIINMNVTLPLISHWNQEIIVTDFWNEPLKWTELFNMHYYIVEFIIRGKVRKFDFIHSPSFKLQDKSKRFATEIYSQGLWDYYAWLQSFYSTENEGNEIRKIKLDSEKVENILKGIKESENKFLKGMPMEEVIGHFQTMTTKKSKNGKPFMTVEQLISFLLKGFRNDTTQPKQELNLVNGEKGFVIKRFYEFFVYAVSKHNELNKKDKYIKLLSDNFDNWGEKQIVSFFKPGKTKRTW